MRILELWVGRGDGRRLGPAQPGEIEGPQVGQRPAARERLEDPVRVGPHELDEHDRGRVRVRAQPLELLHREATNVLELGHRALADDLGRAHPEVGVKVDVLHRRPRWQANRRDRGLERAHPDDREESPAKLPAALEQDEPEPVGPTLAELLEQFELASGRLRVGPVPGALQDDELTAGIAVALEVVGVDEPMLVARRVGMDRGQQRRRGPLPDLDPRAGLGDRLGQRVNRGHQRGVEGRSPSVAVLDALGELEEGPVGGLDPDAAQPGHGHVGVGLDVARVEDRSVEARVVDRGQLGQDLEIERPRGLAAKRDLAGPRPQPTGEPGVGRALAQLLEPLGREVDARVGERRVDLGEIADRRDPQRGEPGPLLVAAERQGWAFDGDQVAELVNQRSDRVGADQPPGVEQPAQGLIHVPAAKLSERVVE